MDRDDLITEMALTWTKNGGDYLGYLTAHDEIAEQIAEYEEEMDDERTRIEMELAAVAEMDDADYRRKRAREERVKDFFAEEHEDNYGPDWAADLSKSF